MLNIKVIGKKLYINCSERVIINTVEKDTSTIKEALLSFDGENVEISFKDLKDMDTTYVQLFLSLILTLKRKDIPYTFSHLNNNIIEIFTLYGVSIEQLTGEKNG
ncbi:MAG: hypothetical protein B6229_10850 [Spirochaetaceae bacterium 4572_7]|nr:MAG: hypothetical protein B6229_10850 [Spirochaetaceae bacterium 4572_7]